jgi:hypothetical protein
MINELVQQLLQYTGSSINNRLAVQQVRWWSNIEELVKQVCCSLVTDIPRYNSAINKRVVQLVVELSRVAQLGSCMNFVSAAR